jgi:hypothetical protein
LSKIFLEKGFNAFKMKVGTDIEDDKRRLRLEKCVQIYFTIPSFGGLDANENDKRRLS